MPSRPAMIGSVVRQVVAPALRECPPQCGIVTITKISVSADAAFADVYVSALQEPDMALEYLEQKHQEFQQSLFRALQRHRVPVIRFRLDDTARKADRIDRLLEEETGG